MTFVEHFVKAWAMRCVDEIAVQRVGDSDVKIVLGTRSVVVPMSQLIVHEDALRAVARAVDSLFGIVRVPTPEPVEPQPDTQRGVT